MWSSGSISSFGRAGFLRRNFGAFLPRFRKSDSNGLFAAFHFSSFAAFARAECSTLFSPHCARDCLAGGLPVSAAGRLPLCWHIPSRQLDITFRREVVRKLSQNGEFFDHGGHREKRKDGRRHHSQAREGKLLHLLLY